MTPDLLRLALEALGRHALRSSLTALGIVIGVSAVVAMVTIGRGAAARVQNEIERLGTELLSLRVGQDTRGGNGAQIEAKPFEPADVDAIRRQIGGTRAVAPVAAQPLRVVANRANWTATVTGTENEFFAARRWRIESGRIFTGHEISAGKSVCIIGATVRAKLFPATEAVGDMLRIKTAPCEVIGVLAARGHSGISQDDDNAVIMPLNSFQRRIQGSQDIQSIMVLAQPGADTFRIKTRIEGLIRERRGIATGQADNFHVLEMRQIAEAMAGTARTLNALLAAIAAVSLLVGGIGIMNIMVVAVTERTAEIGIKLAIGALPSQIMAQFLIEAVVLAAAGGLVGIVVGLGLAALSRLWLDIPLVVDPSVILFAFLASGSIGVVFGYVPAARAARLDPVQALGRE
jgi:putative ABC transport system permease protein